MSAYQLPTPSRPAPPSAPKAVGYTLVGVLVGAAIVGGVVWGGPSWDEDRAVAATPPMRAYNTASDAYNTPPVFVLVFPSETPTRTPPPTTPYPTSSVELCDVADVGALCRQPQPTAPPPTPFPDCPVKPGEICIKGEPVETRYLP